jgi:hypothetical protein
MLAVLRQAEAGLTLTGHLRGAAAHGGFSGTLMALQRHGWLDRETGALTTAGRDQLAEARARAAHARADFQHRLDAIVHAVTAREAAKRPGAPPAHDRG